MKRVAGSGGRGAGEGPAGSATARPTRAARPGSAAYPPWRSRARYRSRVRAARAASSPVYGPVVSRTTTRRSRGESSPAAVSRASAPPAECPRYSYGSRSTGSRARTTRRRSRRWAARPQSAVMSAARAASSRGVTPTTRRPRARRWWARLRSGGVKKPAAKLRPPPGSRYAMARGSRAVSATTSTVSGTGPPRRGAKVARIHPSPCARPTGADPSASAIRDTSTPGPPAPPGPDDEGGPAVLASGATAAASAVSPAPPGPDPAGAAVRAPGSAAAGWAGSDGAVPGGSVGWGPGWCGVWVCGVNWGLPVGRWRPGAGTGGPPWRVSAPAPSLVPAHSPRPRGGGADGVPPSRPWRRRPGRAGRPGRATAPRAGAPRRSRAAPGRRSRWP